ncbi:MAG: response regulator [Bacteroidales bacterium]|nr:response regulator [Bacteroidales bacterium]
MATKQDTVITELKLRIKLLEKQGALSPGWMEEKLLLWLVSETIEMANKSDELLNNLVERICVILDLQYGACCAVKEGHLITHAVYAEDDYNDLNRFVIPLVEESLVKLDEEPHFIESGNVNLKSSGAFDGSVPPFLIGLFPFQSLVIPLGSFVFYATDDNRFKVRQFSLMIHQVIKMAIAKFEKLNLLEELKKVNSSFETELRKRTEELKKKIENVNIDTNKDLENKPTSVKKPEAKDIDFLKDISVEIRTPMNGILGFSEILRDENIPAGEKNNYIDIIKSCANSLMKIVDDAVSYNYIESGKLELKSREFPIAKFLTEIYDHFKKDELYTQREHVDLRLSINVNGNTQLFTDEERLKQILYCLINNAIKFTGEGYIEFGCSRQAKDIQAKDSVKKKDIIFFVKDTGMGISPDIQDKIFDPLFKYEHEISKLYSGLGIGLSLAKNLVHALGGIIWFESVLESGSQFYFTLPESAIVSATEEFLLKDENGEVFYNWEDKKILIVEDDDMSIIYLKEVLRATNASILLAKDGKNAIDLAKKHPEINLILMDIKLPGINGYEVTSIIKEFLNVPIIAQTAYAMADDYKKSQEVGCDEYISKPINRRKLLKLMNNLFAKYESI